MDNLLDVTLPMEENTSIFNKAIKIFYSLEISKEELEEIIKSCKASSKSIESFRECVK